MIANRKKWRSVVSVTREKNCGFLTAKVASIPAYSLNKLRTCNNGATSVEEILQFFFQCNTQQKSAISFWLRIYLKP
ncbi:hypothetical protein [Clostridium saccharobutylicum]|uniref:hypothetical protein n=1 Tax=Clostridium saccharobutylicum TaxID=169679 RepID=UPI00111CF121|nr:hypothetical protein [Clostridium saccharobutylicum]MBA2903545.1 hypothetical protein [Clostridium saccharobutylicum]MBC2439170.1 hypothetical protein [Clostridium saccharobutylicum]MBC2443209.1 hypothetical protein [Clostridium saccharobutylicum]MBC2448045.1 hypothetical protein [Clostridium saccharobutylicum]MBC2469067.1 hypothetical protein [Clostridium saccharobutylicum]